MSNNRLNRPLAFFALIPLIWIVFFDSFSKFLILPLLLKVLYKHESVFFHYHLSTHAINLFYTAFLSVSALIGILITPWIGHLSDRLGRRKMMLVLFAISILGYLVGIFGIISQSFIFILLLNALINISANSQPIAEATIADKFHDKLRSYGFALMSGAMVFAMALGPIAGDFFSDNKITHFFTLQTPLQLGVILSVLNIIMVVFFVKDNKAVSIEKHNPQFLFRLKKMFASTFLRKYFLIFFCLQFSWAIFYQYIPLYFLNTLHTSIHAVTHYLFWVSFIMGIGLFFLYYGLIKLTQFTFTRMVCSSAIVALICSVFLLLNSSLFWLYGLGCILAIVIGLYYPALVALMSEQVDKQNYGLLMGVNTFLMCMAWFISSLLVGLLANLNVHAPFALQITSVFVAVLMLLFSEKKQRQEPLFKNIV